MITFDEARKIAYDANLPAWLELGYRGEYMVADYGLEDAEHYVMIDGAREMLVDENYDFDVLDQPVTVIDKQTGDLFVMTYFESEELRAGMKQVGVWPKLEE